MTFVSGTQESLGARRFWNRAVNALRAVAYQWNARGTVPIESWGWDTFEVRRFRYFHAQSLYHNQVYSALVNYAEQQKFDRKLYKNIRGIYNPVHRLVEMYPAKCY